MKIPSKLKIGGHIVKIEQRQDYDVLGASYVGSNLIVLRKGMHQSQMEASLIHEIFHFINTTFDEGLKHDLMNSFSEQFYQVLKDNSLIQ